MSKNTGFTLIELIAVIVILGILVVTAAPKFIDLQSDAKIARLHGLAGALKSANNIVHGKALIKGANLGNGWNTSTQKQLESATVEIEGVKYFIKYGYLDRVHVLGALQGTQKISIKNGMATDDVSVNVCSSNPCEYDWCGCKATPGSVPGYSFTSGDAQIIVPNGVVPGNYSTEKCYLLYINAKEKTPPQIALFTEGC